MKIPEGVIAKRYAARRATTSSRRICIIQPHWIYKNASWRNKILQLGAHQITKSIQEQRRSDKTSVARDCSENQNDETKPKRWDSSMYTWWTIEIEKHLPDDPSSSDWTDVIPKRQQDTTGQKSNQKIETYLYEDITQERAPYYSNQRRVKRKESVHMLVVISISCDV